MTAEEIRNELARDSMHTQHQVLAEIAAQLAELNERLASWEWPDGKHAINTK